MAIVQDVAARGGLRIHQALARKMGIAILTGHYPPESILGGEIEQSEALGVGRTAYREAVRLLIAKGLIESRPKAGTSVRPRSAWNLLDPQILEWMFSSTPDVRFVRDLFELRAIIEPEAAALAAARRTAGQRDEMGAALADMSRFSLASAEGQAADQLFHRIMIAAAHNEALASLAGSIGAAVQWTTIFKERVGGIARDAVPDHQKVFDAIADRRTVRARKAMRALLGLARDDMQVIRSVKS